MKRGQIVDAAKKTKSKQKLERRLKSRKEETEEDAEERRARNVPNTLDNTREYDMSMGVGGGGGGEQPEQPDDNDNENNSENNKDMHMGTDDPELSSDIANDAFASYFTPQLVNPDDPDSGIKLPKILITTSAGAGKSTIEFCMDLTSVLPNSEYVKRRSGKGYEMGTIAGWARKREYSDMMVVNEDHKTANALTLMHLPSGPTAYFKLSSVKQSKAITVSGWSV